MDGWYIVGSESPVSKTGTADLASMTRLVSYLEN